MKQPPLTHIFFNQALRLLVISCFLSTTTQWSLPAYANTALLLPQPGTRVHLSSLNNPPILKGLKVHPDHPFKFDFILDQGDSNEGKDYAKSLDARQKHSGMTGELDSRKKTTRMTEEQLKHESTKLIKYFLASLTIPQEDLWVNLSPYEKDRIVPEAFGQTEMGRDLLAQDYLLKQITASLMYPEDEIGKKFWKRIYEEAQKKYGNTNIPVNTFNKVWIVPEKAIVYENAQAGTAYVVESRLKVMLEEDYLATTKNQSQPKLRQIKDRQPGDMFQKEHQNMSSSTLPSKKALSAKAPQGNNHLPNETPTRGHVSQKLQNVSSSTLPSELPTNVKASQVDPASRIVSSSSLTSQIIKEIILPELTKEVNEGKNFTQLRQVYNSLILATWYKTKIKNSIINQMYTNKKKVSGIGFSKEDERAGFPTKTFGNDIVVSKDNSKIATDDSNLDTESIYQLYLKAFKKGVYNYIKEEKILLNSDDKSLLISRKYFSGGFNFNHAMITSQHSLPEGLESDSLQKVEVNVVSAQSSQDIQSGASTLTRLTLENNRNEIEDLMRKAKETNQKAHEVYLKKFVNGIAQSNPAINSQFLPQWDPSRQASIVNKSIEFFKTRLFKETSAGKEIYWFLRKKNDVRKFSDSLQKERLVHLLGQASKTNVTTARAITEVEWIEIKKDYTSADRDDFYLVKVVDDNFWEESLVQKDVNTSLNHLAVMSIFTQKIDPILLNMVFVRGVAVSIDNDYTMHYDETKSDEDHFFTSLLLNYLLLFIKIHSKTQNTPYDINRLINHLRDGGKYETVEDVGVEFRRYGFGRGIIEAEGLNIESLRNAILDIKKITDLSDSVHQAGFEGVKAEKFTRILESNRRNLGRLMDRFWNLLTGEDAGLRSLDEPNQHSSFIPLRINELALAEVPEIHREQVHRLISYLDKEYWRSTEFILPTTIADYTSLSLETIHHIISNHIITGLSFKKTPSNIRYLEVVRGINDSNNQAMTVKALPIYFNETKSQLPKILKDGLDVKEKEIGVFEIKVNNRNFQVKEFKSASSDAHHFYFSEQNGDEWEKIGFIYTKPNQEGFDAVAGVYVSPHLRRQYFSTFMAKVLFNILSKRMPSVFIHPDMKNAIFLKILIKEFSFQPVDTQAVANAYFIEQDLSDLEIQKLGFLSEDFPHGKKAFISRQGYIELLENSQWEFQNQYIIIDHINLVAHLPPAIPLFIGQSLKKDLRTKEGSDADFGGIDLTSHIKKMEIRQEGDSFEDLVFHLDPVVLQRFQNSTGFTPVIVNIEPVGDLKIFLEANTVKPLR